MPVYYGQHHQPRPCPAYGKQNAANRLADVCLEADRGKKASKKTADTRGRKESVNALHLAKQRWKTMRLRRPAFALTGEHENNKEWNSVLGIQGRGFKAKVDTVATCNDIMGAYCPLNLCKESSQPTRTHITAYCGAQLDACLRKDNSRGLLPRD